MTLIQVDVLQPKPRQRRLAFLLNVLWREIGKARAIGPEMPEDFGRDDDFIARQISQRPPKHALGMPIPVSVGGIKEIHAQFKSPLNRAQNLLLIHLPPPPRRQLPGPKTNRR